MILGLLTLNIHKGFSIFNRRFILPQLRDAVRSTSADIAFLQEIVGENIKKAQRYLDWPTVPQHEYIAEAFWPDHAYGKNATYPAGNHGNAILSRFPILRTHKEDISSNRFVKRGFLYTRIQLPPAANGKHIHCICVHLGHLSRMREKQFEKIAVYVHKKIPPGDPLIIAGDFNEWKKSRKDILELRLGMIDAGQYIHKRRLRTFPAPVPIFPLDRIYVRGLKIISVKTLRKGIWRLLSDHVGLYAEAEIK
jgi:endonuclease/exonuclease/phosphatase family metal-dependent hydrolase